MATWVTPKLSNQAFISSNALVVVPKALDFSPYLAL
jgi:hypothetical protein